MQTLGLADAMFRQLRLHVADDAKRARDEDKIAEAAKRPRGIVKHASRIGRRNSVANDKAIKKRAENGRASVG